MALAVHTGGKSLHGWFTAKDRAKKGCEPLSALRRHPWCRSGDVGALTFLTNARCTRENGNRQTAYFFNPAVIK